MGEFAIGQPVSRLEDPRLLKGLGRYVDDLDLPGQAHAFILRSPHAHARIRAIDADAAAAMPGVLGVLTGADCAADGLGHLPCDQKRFRRDGGDMYRPPRPVLGARPGAGGGRLRGDGGRRDRGARRATPAERDRGRLPAAARGGLARRRGRAGRAASLGRLPRQRVLLSRGRRRSRGRGRLRRRRSSSSSAASSSAG